MTYTEIQREAAGDPLWQAARCTDWHEAALRFDQARADMWRWRRRYHTEKLILREYFRFHRNGIDMGRSINKQWLQLGVTVRLYRNARDCARCWRRAVKRLGGIHDCSAKGA